MAATKLDKMIEQVSKLHTTLLGASFIIAAFALFVADQTVDRARQDLRSLLSLEGERLDSLVFNSVQRLSSPNPSISRGTERQTALAIKFQGDITRDTLQYLQYFELDQPIAVPKYRNYFASKPMTDIGDCLAEQTTTIRSLNDLQQSWDLLASVAVLEWRADTPLTGTLTLAPTSYGFFKGPTTFQVSATLSRTDQTVSHWNGNTTSLVLCHMNEKPDGGWRLLLQSDAISASQTAKINISLDVPPSMLIQVDGTKAVTVDRNLQIGGRTFEGRFPELMATTTHIRSVSLTDLFAHLSDRLKTNPDRLEIFGAKIPPNTIPLLGAALVCGLQVYLIALLASITCHGQKAIADTEGWWIGFSSSKFSRAAAVVSFMVPLGAAVLMWPSETALAAAAAKIMIVLSAALTFVSMSRLYLFWRS
jgi:hypothetical protein